MLPPGLSMLWESVDPHAALRDRFGFTGRAPVSAWIAAALRSRWEVIAEDCHRLVISDQNVIAWVPSSRGDLIVKWSTAQERFPALAASTGLLHDLSAQGVPVAAPLLTAQGKARAEIAGPLGPLSVAVLPELEGVWLDATDPHAVHAAGAMLARLHEALRRSDHGVPALPAAQEDIAQRVGRWLERSDPGRAPDASRRLSALLATAPTLRAAQQLVHHDYRAANILTSASEVVGVLDFDELGRAHRVDDLARATVLLATRFTDWEPTPKAARVHLRRGYESIAPLDDVERHWLEILVLWYGIAAIPPGAGTERWRAAVECTSMS